MMQNKEGWRRHVEGDLGPLGGVVNANHGVIRKVEK